MGDIGRYFDRSEFACRCNCGFNKISPKLVNILDNMRELVGPITIESGCRCKVWNKKQGGAENSAHLTGKAADIKINSSRGRFNILFAAFDEGIHRLGIARSFIHIDVDENLANDVTWLY
ncbi:MAG: D-Ala-D-Ala carboxypeptidase family metallohydrolase [Thermodesulfobacteriota bacterium]